MFIYSGEKIHTPVLHFLYSLTPSLQVLLPLHHGFLLSNGNVASELFRLRSPNSRNIIQNRMNLFFNFEAIDDILLRNGEPHPVFL